MTDGVSLETQVNEFVAAFLRLLTEAPDSGDADIETERRVFADLLRRANEPATPVHETEMKPVCRFLDDAHQPGGSGLHSDLTAASLPLARRATWRNKYRNIPGREALFENFAFCDYVGPDGWLHTEDVTLGLTMLGPDTDYPFHQHPAVELYFLMSGVSDWAVDYQDYVQREPGTWMYHPGMQPHAIRSLDQPMLAVSAWRGDIHSRSRFCVKEDLKRGSAQ